jgi:hypothetical protein
MIKNDKNHGILFLFKIRFLVLGKSLNILLLNSSFDDGLFFNFHLNITMTYFSSPHFSFYLHDKHSVIISKLNYEFIFFLKFIHILNMILSQIYYNMNN